MPRESTILRRLFRRAHHDDALLEAERAAHVEELARARDDALADLAEARAALEAEHELVVTLASQLEDARRAARAMLRRLEPAIAERADLDLHPTLTAAVEFAALERERAAASEMWIARNVNMPPGRA